MPLKVMWDIVVPVKMPADIKNCKPGELPGSVLRPIPGGGQLHWLAAAAWSAMCEAAEKDGVTLKPTSSGDTYRTLKMQLNAFLSRYQKEPIAGASTRTYEGVKWYKKSPKLASLAAPGSSQHNLGLAVDVHSASEPKRLNWLIANVRKFGFSWEVVPEEPWHLRYTDAENVPDAVKSYMEKNSIKAPLPQAQPTTEKSVKQETSTPTAPTETKVDALKPGDTGEKVKMLQKKLRKEGFFTDVIDGTYGPSTTEAVQKFKKAKDIPAGNSAGAAVLNLLGIK